MHWRCNHVGGHKALFSRRPRSVTKPSLNHQAFLETVVAAQRLQEEVFILSILQLVLVQVLLLQRLLWLILQLTQLHKLSLPLRLTLTLWTSIPLCLTL